jgi:hypothetical protein
MTNGLVVMTPTTVAKTGGSSTATINADGSVTFGSCETLSLNGVFTGDYDNYMVTIRHTPSTSDNINIRLRASGADNSTASSYVRQNLSADNTVLAAGRGTSNIWSGIFASFTTQRDGTTLYFFGPQLAQPTAMRLLAVQSNSGAGFADAACTHNQSASYDGLSFICSTAGVSISGLVTVFGFNQ